MHTMAKSSADTNSTVQPLLPGTSDMIAILHLTHGLVNTGEPVYSYQPCDLWLLLDERRDKDEVELNST